MSHVSKEDGANSEFPSEYMNEEEEAEDYEEEGGEQYDDQEELEEGEEEEPEEDIHTVNSQAQSAQSSRRARQARNHQQRPRHVRQNSQRSEMSSHSSYKSESSRNSGATFYSEGGEDDQSEVASQFRSQQSNAEQSYYVEETAGEPVVEYPPTPAFEKTDCNMIIWGKWKTIYDEPIQLNIEEPDFYNVEDGRPLKVCIEEMVSVQDFCLFISDEQNLYAMGQNLRGMLGLGPEVQSTGSRAIMIRFPGDMRVLDVKVGSNHVLALTEDGSVFGWGGNNFGQVGVSPETEHMATFPGQKVQSTVWTPVRIYPLNVPPETQLLEPDFDFEKCKQIEVYEDSSFLLTEEGSLYSWGRNENGFLGRETKPESGGDNPGKLTFSNFVPARVRKLEKFPVKRISIKNGKFMVFFVNQSINELNDVGPKRGGNPQADTRDSFNSDNTYTTGYSETGSYYTQSTDSRGSELPNKRRGGGGPRVHDVDQTMSNGSNKDSSEVDIEEEKDVVASDLSSVKYRRRPRRSKDSQSQSSRSSGASSRSSRSYSGSQQSSGSKFTGTGTFAGGSQSNRLKRGKVDKDMQRRYDTIKQVIRQSIDVRDDLAKFDRFLADSMKPLTEIQSTNIYDQVIDKFASGQCTSRDAEELREAVDKLQVQLKLSIAKLESIEGKIASDLRDFLQREAADLRRQNERGNLSLEDEAMFKELQVIVDLVGESLTLKKFNLIGCKMRIYQERLKEINFVKLLLTLQGVQEEQDDGVAGVKPEKRMELYQKCVLLSKKVQSSLKKNADYYLQLHVGCSIPSSLALSALTNSVYMQCDSWRGLTAMTQYTAALQDKMVDQQQTHDKMRYLWNIFRKLKETDFDINVKKFKENPNGMNLDDWFKEYVKGARADIDDVTRMVQLQAKENGGQKKSESKQMLFYFNQLVEDSAGIRKILLEIQMTLKSKDSSRVTQWPIDAQMNPQEVSDRSLRQKGSSSSLGAGAPIIGVLNRSGALNSSKRMTRGELSPRSQQSLISAVASNHRSAKKGGNSNADVQSQNGAQSSNKSVRPKEVTPQTPGGGFLGGIFGMFGGNKN